MAATSQPNVAELLKTLERSQQQYLKDTRELHEAILKSLGPSTPGSPTLERKGASVGSPPSPAVRAISFSEEPTSRPTIQTAPTNKRLRRLTNELKDNRWLSNSPGDVFEDDSDDDGNFGGSTPPVTSQISSPVGDERVSRVQTTLSPAPYTDEQLITHLQQAETKDATVAALGDVWRRRAELTSATLFNIGTDSGTGEDDYWANATYEVYEVGKDGLLNPRHDDKSNEDVWGIIKNVNQDGTAIGRITTLQEPSPHLLAGVHLTMQNNFDMDELYSHLVSPMGNKGKTKAYMNRAFETDQIHQRSFFFVFKYYTEIGEGLTPAPWQQCDHRPLDKRGPDHINITECSSILALSLQGDPVKQVKLRSRRRKGVQQGLIYDTFAPYHLLSIQSFPDDIHSLRSEDDKKPLYSGPHAFLDCLAAEYRDATKRYLQLNERISKLITPPNQFVFDVKLRDKLLFEDKDFTFSRRYFWAYNTLGVINDGIKSMISAYTDTFTSDFWAGTHQTLWPHPEPDSEEGRNYLAKISGLRHELERAVKDLRAVMNSNEYIRQEIVSLREQLFSGSSVKESRRAIEQGDNIKILTGISMLFLPLTFVTSVFGITEFQFSADDWRFPLTMVTVCIPFFVLIFILQTRAGSDAVKKLGNFVENHIGRWSDRSRSRHERRLQLQQQLQAAGASNDTASSIANMGRRKRFGRKKKKRGESQKQMEVINGVPNGSVDGDPGVTWWRNWRSNGVGDGLEMVVQVSNV